MAADGTSRRLEDAPEPVDRPDKPDTPADVEAVVEVRLPQDVREFSATSAPISPPR